MVSGHRPEVPELVFTIPEVELIIRGRSVRLINGWTIGASTVRALRALVEAARALPDAELPVPFLPLVDHALAPEYQDKVRELTRAIQQGSLSKAILSRRVVFDGRLDVPGTYAVSSRINSGVRSFGFRTPRGVARGDQRRNRHDVSSGWHTPPRGRRS